MYWWNQNLNKAEKELSAIKAKLPAFPVAKHWQPADKCASCREWGKDGNIHLVVYTSIITSFGNEYLIMMVYPCEFPNKIPVVFTKSQLKPSCPHYFKNGQLCLGSSSNNPSISGAEILGWAKDWFECYDVWCMTGKFMPQNHGRHRIPRKKSARKKKKSLWQKIFG